jgi:predicted nucleotidyltransferase
MRQLEANNLESVRRWVGGSQRWVKAFLPSISSLPHVVAVIAMGSAVRDRGHRRSDLDLLLVYREKRPAVKPPLEVDIRFTRLDQLDDLVAKGSEIVCWALKFGAALYDPENYWEQLQHKWKGRIPLPSAIEARTRAMQTLERAKEMLELDDDSAADDLLLTALTQFARERLIQHHVFPASRPELPDQLRELNRDDPLAGLLEAAMFGDSGARDIIVALDKC